MGFYDNMGSLATRMVEKFTIGNAYIYNITAETYNPTTGETTRTTESANVPIAQINITQEKEQNWSQDSFLLYVAGSHLGTFVPKVDSIITMPDGKSHFIKRIEPYPQGAAYKLFVSKDVCQV